MAVDTASAYGNASRAGPCRRTLDNVRRGDHDHSTATLDWYGCATFRLTLPGDLVVFLDAYIDRVPGAAGPKPPQSADDVDRADWIVVGHSHFDHLWGAERIALRTGATIIGSYETVRVMADRGVPEPSS